VKKYIHVSWSILNQSTELLEVKTILDKPWKITGRMVDFVYENLHSESTFTKALTPFPHILIALKSGNQTSNKSNSKISMHTINLFPNNIQIKLKLYSPCTTIKFERMLHFVLTAVIL
jgi:hypothetical protein